MQLAFCLTLEGKTTFAELKEYVKNLEMFGVKDDEFLEVYADKFIELKNISVDTISCGDCYEGQDILVNTHKCEKVAKPYPQRDLYRKKDIL